MSTQKRSQSQEDLEEQYAEHFEFLRSSARAFDTGKSSEAKRLAVSLRVLLHSSRTSHALLAQIGLQDILFFDTAEDVNPHNLIPTFGLLKVVLGPTSAQYAPFTTDAPPWPVWMLPFDAWWRKPVVVVPSESISLTRRDLVLTMANQDGGAHVDPEIEEAYYRVSREHDASWTVDTAYGPQPLPDLERGSVRQIAQEVLVSLVHRLREVPSDLPPPPEQKRHAVIHNAQTGETRREEYTLRNVCPCKSGKEYFDCHGRRPGS